MYNSLREVAEVMRKGRISIVTPVYNGDKTLERTINSVISQNYTDFEYIIVDGNSNDNTELVVRKYNKYISNYIREEDSGIYEAINKGISATTGEIIGIINCDDWYEPNIFGLVSDLFENEKVELVYGNLNLVEENSVLLLKPNMLSRFCIEMVNFHPSSFVRRNLYEKIGCYSTDYKLASDYDFFLKCYLNHSRFKYTDNVLANFSLGGLSTVKRDLCISETHSIVKKYIDDEILLLCFKEYLYKRITVYGAGFWGECIVNKLTKLYTKDIIWVDSDESKQGIIKYNLEIQGPRIIEADRQLLIGVYDGEKIRADYEARGLKVVTVKELLNRYMDFLYEAYCQSISQ